ncbi:MAG: hypothetical protein KKC71_06375 [Chloroflexi bacterium]|nr:hypothetical protein [Chloroflexota bacterium]
MSEISLKDIKIFFDEDGKAREVLISYETFQRIEALLREFRGKKDDQAYFWAEGWQKRIREAEADISAGRTYKVDLQNADKSLEWLDE